MHLENKFSVGGDNGGGGVPILTPVILSADFVFNYTDLHVVDTRAGVIYGDLPLTPTVGQIVSFMDYAGTWGDNSFFVRNTDEVLMELAEPLEFSESFMSVALIFIDSVVGWRLY